MFAGMYFSYRQKETEREKEYPFVGTDQATHFNIKLILHSMICMYYCYAEVKFKYLKTLNLFIIDEVLHNHCRLASHSDRHHRKSDNS